MSSRRTEPPTPRRLRDARRRGEIATSRELTGAAALAAGLAGLALGGPSAVAALTRAMSCELARALDGDPGEAAWPSLLRAASLLARVALPGCAVAAAGAFVAGAAQTRALVAPAALRPRLDRMHLGRGFRRLVSTERFGSAALAAAKVGLLLVAGWAVAARVAPPFAAAPSPTAPAQLRLLSSVASGIAPPLAALSLVLGALDLLLARRRWLVRLSMTREEVRRERREEEGDPRLRAERRRLHRAIAAAAPLARATCLVVNPTHVAVALHHAPDRDEAPVVVAKGVGRAAAALRAFARGAGVPVVRDPALARALYRLSEVGEEIPEELYEAAAAVLVHVHAMSGRGA